jgi:hypothetical protein
MSAPYTNGSPSPTSTAIPRPITGQQLAKGRFTYRDKVKLAVALSQGTAVLGPMTATQAAAVTGVSPLDVVKARAGKLGNGKRNGRNGHGESLANHIVRSTPAERLEAARVVGPALLWDQMISPVIAEDRAEVAAE